MATSVKMSVSKVANSADTFANTSKIKVEVKATTTGESWNASGDTKGFVAIDGVQVASLSGKKFYKNTTTTLYSGTHTVLHNEDGTKTATVSFEFDTQIAAGVASDEQEITLDPIMRGVVPTIPTITLGQECSIVMKNTGGFVYDLKWEVGTKRGTLKENSFDGVVTWTPSVDLASESTHTKTLDGALVVTNYSNGEVLGTFRYSFSALFPDNIAPVIKSFTPSFTVHDVGIKGENRFTYAVAAEGQYGAEVTDCTVSFGGQTVNGFSGQTNILQQSGVFNPVIKVTDSRGKVATVTESALRVYAYIAPSFISTEAFRSDEDGNPLSNSTLVTVRATASYEPMDGNNTATIRARKREVEGYWSEYIEILPQRNNILSGFSAAKSYEVEISVVDEVSEPKTVTYIIPTESVSFHLKRGGNGAAFGKYATADNTIETEWDIDMRGHKVQQLAEPVADTDAATKGYVDTKTASAEMLFDTEYLTDEKWNGNAVYTMLVDFGTLPNNEEKGVEGKLASGLNVIYMSGHAYSSETDYCIPIPGYYAIQSFGYTKSSGYFWLSTTRDMRSYNAYITVKYTK